MSPVNAPRQTLVPIVPGVILSYACRVRRRRTRRRSTRRICACRRWTRMAIGAVVLTVCLAPRPVHTARADVTGLWVRQATLVSADSIDRLVQEASDAGFTTLLVEIPDTLGSARPGRRPRVRRSRAFDGVRTVVTAAHRHGLRVHAWVQTTLVATAGNLPTSSSHLVHQHPEWLMVPRGLAAELARLDVHSPAYLGALDRWARQHPDEMDGLYLSPIIPEAAAVPIRRGAPGLGTVSQ